MTFMEGINESLIKPVRILNKARLDLASLDEKFSPTRTVIIGFRIFQRQGGGELSER